MTKERRKTIWRLGARWPYDEDSNIFPDSQRKQNVSGGIDAAATGVGRLGRRNEDAGWCQTSLSRGENETNSGADSLVLRDVQVLNSVLRIMLQIHPGTHSGDPRRRVACLLPSSAFYLVLAIAIVMDSFPPNIFSMVSEKEWQMYLNK